MNKLDNIFNNDIMLILLLNVYYKAESDQS